MRFAAAVALAFVAAVWAAPMSGSAVALQRAKIDAFTPYTHIASAGYCQPARTLAWNCGIHCDATPGFVTTASGGDGGTAPYWLVGYYPPLESIFVSYQGTEAQKITPLLVDIDFFLDPLNSTYFPSVASSVMTHGGFGDAHERSANDVLAAVKTTLGQHPGAQIVTTGHSLGAAVAQISAVHLLLNLPSGAKVKYVGFAAPRVGNPAWANLVDSLVGDVTHINNKKDFVPTIPPLFAGFAHPSGEIHINANDEWITCSGRDSQAKGCTMDAVPNILVSNILDHRGPYNGIHLGQSDCAA